MEKRGNIRVKQSIISRLHVIRQKQGNEIPLKMYELVEKILEAFIALEEGK